MQEGTRILWGMQEGTRILASDPTPAPETNYEFTPGGYEDLRGVQNPGNTPRPKVYSKLRGT